MSKGSARSRGLRCAALGIAASALAAACMAAAETAAAVTARIEARSADLLAGGRNRTDSSGAEASGADRRERAADMRVI